MLHLFDPNGDHLPSTGDQFFLHLLAFGRVRHGIQTDHREPIADAHDHIGVIHRYTPNTTTIGYTAILGSYEGYGGVAEPEAPVLRGAFGGPIA